MYATDKLKNGYDAFYNQFLDKSRPVNLLELGIAQGGSLAYWSDYFPKESKIVGVDINLPSNFVCPDNVRMYQGSQDDKTFLDSICQEYAGFDIIIDDASHLGLLTKKSWQILFRHLKPGGYYVIEDWGTGYWGDWYDGQVLDPAKGRIKTVFHKILNRVGINVKFDFPSHTAGMVGFIKSLVDEVGIADVVRAGIEPLNEPVKKHIDYVTYYPSLVVVKKSLEV